MWQKPYFFVASMQVVSCSKSEVCAQKTGQKTVFPVLKTGPTYDDQLQTQTWKLSAVKIWLLKELLLPAIQQRKSLIFLGSVFLGDLICFEAHVCDPKVSLPSRQRHKRILLFSHSYCYYYWNRIGIEFDMKIKVGGGWKRRMKQDFWDK